jgi:hypothetical protein
MRGSEEGQDATGSEMCSMAVRLGCCGYAVRADAGENAHGVCGLSACQHADGGNVLVHKKTVLLVPSKPLPSYPPSPAPPPQVCPRS